MQRDNTWCKRAFRRATDSGDASSRSSLSSADKLARHLAIAHHKQEWLFAQLLQRGWLILKLFDIG